VKLKAISSASFLLNQDATTVSMTPFKRKGKGDRDLPSNADDIALWRLEPSNKDAEGNMAAAEGNEAEHYLVRLVPAQSRCNNSQHDSVQTKRKGRPSAVLTLSNRRTNTRLTLRLSCLEGSFPEPTVVRPVDDYE
jgi:hypothetical protein